MDKIIIFGSNGHIGSKLHESLSKKYNIYTSSREKKVNTSNFIKVNLDDKESIDYFVEKTPKFNVIIFLVGLAHNKGSRKDLSKHEKVNFLTLKNLLETLRLKDKMPDKVIFTSSVSVYGEKIDIEKYSEVMPLLPYSPYALTKKQAEKYLLDSFKNKTWILRLAPVYHSDFQLNINRRTLISNIFYRVSNGKTKLSLCNMKNIEHCIDSIINNSIPPSIYNVSDSKTYTYNDLLLFQKAKFILYIPSFLIFILFRFGLLINNIYLIENSIKLLSNNIFSSRKLQKFISLDYNLNDE